MDFRIISLLRLLDHALMGGLARSFGRASWLPVRVRHWPYNALDRLCQRRIATTYGPPEGGFHFVFFSCKRHFHLLECAVASLIRMQGSRLIGVSVFVDEGDFLERSEVAKLHDIYDNIKIEP